MRDPEEYSNEEYSSEDDIENPEQESPEVKRRRDAFFSDVRLLVFSTSISVQPPCTTNPRCTLPVLSRPHIFSNS